VAVVAGGGHIDPPLGGLAVDAGLIDLDRVVDQDLVLGGDVQVFMAPAAGLRQVDRVGHGVLDARGQNIVIPMAVGAGGHIFAISNALPPVGLVLFTLLFMTRPATLASHHKSLLSLVRIRGPILMAVQAVEAVMSRVR
jgi:hypothetical protein